MIVTIEHEIQIDEYKYIPYMKITKYYSDVPSIKKALVIDFENESLEIHKNKTGTSLFIKFYDLNGHKHIFNLNPKKKNNPIIPILKWIKQEYYDFLEIQDFFKDIKI